MKQKTGIMSLGQWLGFLIFICSLYILWQIKDLLLLIFTSIIFTTALNRLVRFLNQKFGIRRKLGIVIVLMLVFLLFSLFFFLIIPPFVEQFQELISLLPEIGEKLRNQLVQLRSQYFEWLPPIPTSSVLIKQIQPLGTAVFQNFWSFFSNTFYVLLQLLLIFVITCMMLVNPQQYRMAFIKLFPSFYRKRTDYILTECEVALGNWLAGITINCLFIASLSGLGLWVLQVNLVLAHALLAGLLNFIPNIGPTASVIFPTMIALIDAPWKIPAIILWYFFVQNVESYWLTPTVMAKQVSLLPAVTLTAQIIFTTIFGLLGLLLALPLTVVTKIWVEELLFKDILDQWDLIQ
jgi:predicted PurR-regulated permease PerM